jgi:hypothetical protein
MISFRRTQAHRTAPGRVGPRPIDAGGARALNLIEDSNTHPSVMIRIRYRTFLVDSSFPARFSNSRVTGHLT